MKTASTRKLTAVASREQRALELLGRYEALSATGKAAIESLFTFGAPTKPDTGEDARLLVSARNAQREAGSFTKMNRSLRSARGTIELLFQLFETRRHLPDDVDWYSVADLLDQCRDGFSNMAPALDCLEQFDRDLQKPANGAPPALANGDAR